MSHVTIVSDFKHHLICLLKFILTPKRINTYNVEFSYNILLLYGVKYLVTNKLDLQNIMTTFLRNNRGSLKQFSSLIKHVLKYYVHKEHRKPQQKMSQKNYSRIFILRLYQHISTSYTLLSHTFLLLHVLNLQNRQLFTRSIHAENCGNWSKFFNKGAQSNLLTIMCQIPKPVD